MNIKLQVIVRKDLGLSEGAMAAQVAHLAMEWLRDPALACTELSSNQVEWLKHPYIYILTVDNLEELNAINERAIDKGISSNEWIDLIWSENLRQNHRVKVGIVLEPNDSDKLKEITGNLKLL